MELCLGTVQFGMDYGIVGQKKPSLKDSVTCLDYATQNGVTAIDTATAYGSAEEVTGAFLRRKTIARTKLFISSKMLPNVLDEYASTEYYKIIRQHIINSLQILGTDYLDAYLLHSARYAYCDEILDALYCIKQEGFANKVGVSVYEPEEAFACLDNPKVDFMQLPYSLFDHRMKKAKVLDHENIARVQTHARSAFLQGLILLEEQQVPNFLQDAKPIVRKVSELCCRYSINRVQLAMAYVKRQSGITHLVFGVDNLQQLKEDISLFEQTLDVQMLSEIGKEFDDIQASVVMPSLWKR